MVVICDYVEMIRERTAALHDKVLQTKKTLIDNKIEIDRHSPDCKVPVITDHLSPVPSTKYLIQGSNAKYYLRAST